MNRRHHRRLECLVVVVVVGVVALAGCRRDPAGRPAPSGAAVSGDAAFDRLSADILDDHLRRHPTDATDLGIHKYDDQIENVSRDGIAAEVQAIRQFRDRLDRTDPASLTPARQLDRRQLMLALDSGLLTLEVIRPWAKDPDAYSSGITRSAYVIMKRAYAPAEQRLIQLVAREKKMIQTLAAGRANLENPPKIYTQIALEQVDGERSFFAADVPAAFASVTDPALLADFRAANAAVIAALGEYKTFLQQRLLPESTGVFALGEETYRKKLAADEMIDLPLDRLLEIAEADRRKNEEAFVAAAHDIDPGKPAAAVLASLQADHPPSSRLLAVTQTTLDSLRQFVADRHILTVPPSPPAHVEETPPFMRSTTTASMDTPGPFETVATEAYYNMTLPDPRASAARQEDYMRGWYYAAISNVSVHEVYPGHYLQFLYARQFPSDVRKVFSATTNVEGWAHYCEQMILEEGFHAGEPKYRLAQLQDALLRDIRFIAGIRMHARGMTVEEAERLFEEQGHQPATVALQEAKRGTSDPTYGYYTMGKLMILKLRDDYRQKLGPAFTLQGFHDAFIRLGPLPLPLVRQAMLGEAGSPL